MMKVRDFGGGGGSSSSSSSSSSNEAHAVKTSSGEEVKLQAFLISTLDKAPGVTCLLTAL